MIRKDIINELEKTLYVRYNWSKDYDNEILMSEYALYYNKRSKKPLAYLQIGFITDSDEVMGADIIYITNGERHEMEIERIADIPEIIKKIVG